MKQTTTGYMNIDVIGNEDLYPDQGYDFPVHNNPRPGLNSRTSAMFPLNKKINDQAKPGKPLSQPPEAVIDPVFPKVRSHRSKLIYETMVKTRAKQVDYNQRKREYDAEVKDAEDAEEMQQIALAKAKEQRQREKERQKMLELNETYKQQLAEVERNREREKRELQQYEHKLRLHYLEQEKEERKKMEKQRMIQEERKEEFRRINDQMLMKRANKIEKEYEEDLKIRKENAEIQAIQDARAAEEKRRRMELTRKREIAADLMAKDLERSRKKNNEAQEAAESAAAKASMREIMELKTKHENMLEERHNDWMNLQRERQARRRTGVKRNFPQRIEPFDAEAFAAEQRRREISRVKEFQKNQIEERKRMEKEEIENDLRLDREMLRMAQEKFDKSLASMQNFIPPELGITVPTYNVSQSFSSTRLH